MITPPLISQVSVEVYERRCETSLLIGDHAEAIVQATLALAAFPETPKAYEMLLKVLAKTGEEGEMITLWENFHKKFPEDAMKDLLLEEICWGVLRKGGKSDRLQTKLIALIGAALNQDIYAVKALKEALNDSSTVIRNVATELSAHYGDAELQEEIAAKFLQEKSWDVREALLGAIGELKIRSLLPELMKLTRNPSVSSEEKREAIKTISLLHEKPQRAELQDLVSSRWSSERSLACKLIAEYGLDQEQDLLSTLLKDSHREVKREALLAWGRLRLFPSEHIQEMAISKDPLIALLASWILLLGDPEKGEELIAKWLLHDKEDVRLFAASVVAGSGEYGIPIAKQMIDQSKDAYVRANLALVLLKQRVEVKKSSEILYEFLHGHREQLMIKKEPFPLIQKSNVRHGALISDLPEVINQVSRLEILNLLAIVEYPKASSAIREFLKKGRWEVVGVAAETLLGEGDESAIALVQELLNDPDREIRLESALLLAVWGRDKQALPLLMEAYPTADRTMKIKILEALGRLGEREAIPFLLKGLKDPSQLFRIISASVLIQTLNH